MACMELCRLPGVLHGRPRQHGALGGVVAESATYFSSSAFRRRLRALIPCLAYSGALGRLMAFGELDTTLQPPLGFFPAICCIRFLCFSPSGLCWAHIGPLALSSTWFLLSSTSDSACDELLMRGVHVSCAISLTYFVAVLVNVMRSVEP